MGVVVSGGWGEGAGFSAEPGGVAGGLDLFADPACRHEFSFACAEHGDVAVVRESVGGGFADAENDRCGGDGEGGCSFELLVGVIPLCFAQCSSSDLLSDGYVCRDNSPRAWQNKVLYCTSQGEMIVDSLGESTCVAMFVLMGVVGGSGVLKSLADGGSGCSCGGRSGGNVVPHRRRFGGVSKSCLGGRDAVAVVNQFGGNEGSELAEGDARQVGMSVVVAAYPVGERVRSLWGREVVARKDQNVVDRHAGGEGGFEHGASSFGEGVDEFGVEAEFAVADWSGLGVRDLDAGTDDGVDTLVDADSGGVEVDVAVAERGEFIASNANGGVESEDEPQVRVVLCHVVEDLFKVAVAGCFRVVSWGSGWFSESSDVAVEVLAAAAVVQHSADLPVNLANRGG